MVQAQRQKTAFTRVIFSPQLILQFTEDIQWFYLRKNYFLRIQSGSNIFQRGSAISRGEGGQNANF